MEDTVQCLSKNEQTQGAGDGKEVLKAVRSGLKWITLTNILVQAVRPLTMLLLARMLAPSAYGIMAVAAIVIELLRLLRDLGMGQAYIQYRGDAEEMLNQTFWLQLIFGCVLTVAVWMAAGPLAKLLGKAEVIPVLRFLSLSFVLYPFSDAPLNKMLRQLDFKAAFYRQVIPAVVSIPLSLYLAWLGMGVWALAISSVASIAATGALVMYLSRWWPSRPQWNKQLVSTALAFGGHVSAQNFLIWVGNSIDQTFLSKFQTTDSIGLFRTGSIVGNFGYTMVAAPFNGVILPWFSRVEERSDMQKTYLSSLRILALVSVPANIFLLGVAAPHIGVLLSRKWSDAAPIAVFFGLLNVISCVFSLNLEVLKAVGKPEVATRLSMIRIIGAPLVLYFAARASIYHLALAQMALAYVTGIAFAPIVAGALGLRWRDLLAACVPGFKVALPLAVVASTIQISFNWIAPSWGTFWISSSLAAAVTYLAFRHFEPEDMKRIIGVLMKRTSGTLSPAGTKG